MFQVYIPTILETSSQIVISQDQEPSLQKGAYTMGDLFYGTGSP